MFMRVLRSLRIWLINLSTPDNSVANITRLTVWYYHPRVTQKVDLITFRPHGQYLCYVP